MQQYHDLDVTDLRFLLCDADGNLFPSEEPAFVASAEVTNALLVSLGQPGEWTPEELRLSTTGKNFRSTAVDLCIGAGVPVHPALADRHSGARTQAAPGEPVLTPELLEYWVAEEKRQVSAYLGEVLEPDPEVLNPLSKMAPHLTLAAVSSSALSRLAACFDATGLTPLITAARRYSAEDSLATPISKPHPAVYQLAGRSLGCTGRQALAVEDSVPGAQSAVAAGFPTIGNLVFVPEAERADRVEQLRAANVAAVVTSWHELADLVLPA